MLRDFSFKILSLLVFPFLIFLGGLFSNLILADSHIGPPTLIYPTQEDSPIFAGEIGFRWTDTGANFYKYHIDLPAGEAKEETIGAFSKKIYDLKPADYSWAVSSCNDAAGEDCGEWSDREDFTVISAPLQYFGGLIPCGRKYDNPATEINESQPCQLGHIFLLLKNILDFLLFRLGFVILGILAIATGVIFYFSLGAPKTMVKVKSLLKSALVGYGIIFLGWLIINWILVLLGFQEEFFGRWWQIIF